MELRLRAPLRQEQLRGHVPVQQQRRRRRRRRRITTTTTTTTTMLLLLLSSTTQLRRSRLERQARNVLCEGMHSGGAACCPPLL